MRISEIPGDVFRNFGKGEIKKLPDSNICGHGVRRYIRQVILPNLGEKLGWLRFVHSYYADFPFETVEVHVSEENASADPGVKHPEIVGAVYYVPASYYSDESLCHFYDIHAGKKGTDGENIVIIGICLQQEARSRLPD